MQVVKPQKPVYENFNKVIIKPKVFNNKFKVTHIYFFKLQSQQERNTTVILLCHPQTK